MTFDLPIELGIEEPPTALLWVWFFLAQHYNKLGNQPLALEFIDKAIDHTPTHIELYMLKSKIFQVRTYSAIKSSFISSQTGHRHPSQAWPDPHVNGGSGKLRIPNLCQLQKICSGRK